jgi:hypothetical protein
MYMSFDHNRAPSQQVYSLNLRPYSKSSLALTLNEWRFNLSFSWMSMLFLNSCRVSSHIVRYDTNPPAIQKQQWHWREVQIEPPLIECGCEWAFRIYGRIVAIIVEDMRCAHETIYHEQTQCTRATIFLWEQVHNLSRIKVSVIKPVKMTKDD